MKFLYNFEELSWMEINLYPRNNKLYEWLNYVGHTLYVYPIVRKNLRLCEIVSIHLGRHLLIATVMDGYIAKSGRPSLPHKFNKIIHSFGFHEHRWVGGGIKQNWKFALGAILCNFAILFNILQIACHYCEMCFMFSHCTNSPFPTN